MYLHVYEERERQKEREREGRSFRGIVATLVKMYKATRVQKLDKAECISHSAKKNIRRE